jgi:hypothetical protein
MLLLGSKTQILTDSRTNATKSREEHPEPPDGPAREETPDGERDQNKTDAAENTL